MVIQTKKRYFIFSFSASQASASRFEIKGFHMPSQQSFGKQILPLKLFQRLFFFFFLLQVFLHVKYFSHIKKIFDDNFVQHLNSLCISVNPDISLVWTAL